MFHLYLGAEGSTEEQLVSLNKGTSVDMNKRAIDSVREYDIVTEASSFVRAWIPFLSGLGAVLEDALAVVDRVQGGTEVLAEHGVRLHALARVTPPLFRQAAAVA